MVKSRLEGEISTKEVRMGTRIVLPEQKGENLKFQQGEELARQLGG